MDARGTEFKVGLFTIAGIAVTFFSIVVLSPDLLETDEKKSYYTILKDAAGILPKTHVKTNGVNIGKVISVELTDSATKVTIEIKGDVKVPKGSTIEVRTVGFLGDKFIEIQRVEDRGQGQISPDEIIPRSMDSSDLNEVLGLIGDIAKDVKKVTNNLANVLGDKQGEAAIDDIVGNIRDMTASAKRILEDNEQDVRLVVDNVREFSTNLNELIDEDNKDRLNRIIAAFDESMLEVKGATKNINLITSKIETGEGTLGRLVNDDKTMDEIEGTLSDLRKVLAPVSELQVNVNYRGEVRGDETFQNYFNLNFHTRPGNYYVVGFTDLAKKNRTTITGPNETVSTGTKVVETIEEQNALRFNLQFGRRWNWLGLRFGLFESTGGVGADFYLGERFRLTTEVYEFADKDSPVRDFARIKAYASALFFNHVYLFAGIDDVTRKKNPDNLAEDAGSTFMVGAGLSFNDADLKALFGVASLAAP